jgi:nitrogen regulatory protein P-II 1
MMIKKITAIISTMQVESVSNVLRGHGVTGFSIHPVTGRGTYSNTFTQDELVPHTQIVVYTREKFARKIAQLIAETADVNSDSQGLVTITSVDEFFWVYQNKPAQDDDFNFIEALNEHESGGTHE